MFLKEYWLNQIAKVSNVSKVSVIFFLNIRVIVFIFSLREGNYA